MRMMTRFHHATRSLNVSGTVEFVSMGKWVTDYLVKLRGLGWTVEELTPVQLDVPDAEELQCVIDVLDAVGAPTVMGQDESGADVPYTVHARVQAVIATLRAGWQPIETAPIDGSKMLLYHHYNGQDIIEIRPYCHVGSGGARSYHAYATHWQPLPAPPGQPDAPRSEKP